MQGHGKQLGLRQHTGTSPVSYRHNFLDFSFLCMHSKSENRADNVDLDSAALLLYMQSEY